MLGLARGGVPVAAEVARALGAPLDVLVVRKIGAPGNPEYGIGAIAEGGVQVFDRLAVRRTLASHGELEASVRHAHRQLDERVERYRGGRPPLDVAGRTVIIVDDGLATGGTARSALRAVRARGARRLVLAVPVGAPESVAALQAEADHVVCVLQATRPARRRRVVRVLPAHGRRRGAGAARRGRAGGGPVRRRPAGGDLGGDGPRRGPASP